MFVLSRKTQASPNELFVCLARIAFNEKWHFTSVSCYRVFAYVFISCFVCICDFSMRRSHRRHSPDIISANKWQLFSLTTYRHEGNKYNWNGKRMRTVSIDRSTRKRKRERKKSKEIGKWNKWENEVNECDERNASRQTNWMKMKIKLSRVERRAARSFFWFDDRSQRNAVFFHVFFMHLNVIYAVFLRSFTAVTTTISLKRRNFIAFSFAHS